LNNNRIDGGYPFIHFVVRTAVMAALTSAAVIIYAPFRRMPVSHNGIIALIGSRRNGSVQRTSDEC
jgi:hypothetical protein